MSATNQAEQTALTLPARAAVAFGESANAVKLRELAAQSAGIVTINSPDGRDEAHRAAMVLRTTRTNITNTGKAAREDATAFSKAVIALERDLIAIIEPEEARILTLRDGWDEQIAAEKAAKILAERQRTEAIEARIQRIRNAPLGVVGKSSGVIREARDAVRDLVIGEELYGELTYQDKAMEARSEAFNALEAAFDAAEKAEWAAHAAEEARKAEAARIEQERATLAAQRIEQERIANENAATARRLADQEAAQALAAKQLADKAAANLRAEREAQELAIRLQREAAAETQRKAEAEILRARNELAAEQAAHAAAVRLEVDHAEALEINATFDAAIARIAAVDTPTFYIEPADDLARCNATFAEFENRHAASVEAYEAAGLGSPDLTDEEIIEFGKEWELGLPALVARMEKFVVDQRELAEMLAAA